MVAKRRYRRQYIERQGIRMAENLSKKQTSPYQQAFGRMKRVSPNLFKMDAGSYNALMGEFARRIRLEEGEMLRERPDIIEAMLETMRRYMKASPSAERPLGENEYRVYVDYTMPLDREILESEFSKKHVSKLFYGNYEWQPHSSCAEIDQTPGERIMLVKHFSRNTTSEANIVEMGKLGYRPATHLEAYAFAKANPELQRQFWIVALGSFTWHDDYHRVALLRGDADRRGLGDYWFEYKWDCFSRFLFVRK